MPLETFLQMNCRKCDTVNPMVYFAPVQIDAHKGTCICIACAIASGYTTSQGDLKEGVTL